jgi:hypothetical protein
VLVSCIELKIIYALDLYGRETAQAPETYKYLYKKQDKRG